MHNAYVICTSLYLYVSRCICMYLGIIGAVSNAYVPVCLVYSDDIHAHTFTYAFLRAMHIHMYVTVFPCISVCMSMQHTCFIQRWPLRACCALAARLLRVCCAVAARSPRGHCTARVAARSLHVRRAGSACTCAGIFIQISPKAVAGCNNQRSYVERCRLNWRLDLPVVHYLTPVARQSGDGQ